MMGPVSAPDNRWPRSVYDRGSEPDPRFSLANERTFLAWVRTGLALLAGSAAVDALDLPLADTVQTALAAALALAALVTATVAWRSWAVTERAMRQGRPLPSNPAMAVVLLAVVVTALVLGVGALTGG
jgi:putative membrane protein